MDASKASSNGQNVGRAHRVALGPTRTSWTWVTLIIAVVLGIALVDFLVQNTRSTEIEFFSISGRVPLTAALLVAALAGASVVLVVGVARMIQLRRRVRASAVAGTGAVTEPLGAPQSRVVGAAPDEPSDDDNFDV